MRAEKSDYHGKQIDLLEFIAEARDRLVLETERRLRRPRNLHRLEHGRDCVGRGVRSALANGDYLVQERVPTAREVFPALLEDGSVEFAEQLVDLDPLLFNGKVGSAFTRLSSYGAGQRLLRRRHGSDFYHQRKVKSGDSDQIQNRTRLQPLTFGVLNRIESLAYDQF